MAEVTNRAVVADRTRRRPQADGVCPRHEVREAVRPNDPADLKRALARLEGLLGSGQPPRHDVPPGFYFNARV